MQRPAKPSTPVRFRPPPPEHPPVSPAYHRREPNGRLVASPRHIDATNGHLIEGEKLKYVLAPACDQKDLK